MCGDFIIVHSCDHWFHNGFPTVVGSFQQKMVTTSVSELPPLHDNSLHPRCSGQALSPLETCSSLLYNSGRQVLSSGRNAVRSRLPRSSRFCILVLTTTRGLLSSSVRTVRGRSIFSSPLHSQSTKATLKGEHHQHTLISPHSTDIP